MTTRLDTQHDLRHLQRIYRNYSNSFEMVLTDIQVGGKKVLVRVDFNVPLDRDFNVTDTTRLEGALPTLRYLLDAGATIIIASHFGRPQKDKNEDGSIKRVKYSLRHVVPTLSEMLGTTVHFIDDTVGDQVQNASAALRPGEVLLLENTRFYPEEKKGDADFAQKLADLADVYVNDAFGTAHRKHASTATVAEYFNADQKAFGFLMGKELENARRLLDNPAKPFVAILGGAKVSDKIQLIQEMMDRVDHIIIGGGMAYTFINARGGKIGNSLVQTEQLELANSLIKQAAAKNIGLHLPIDSVIADGFSNEATHQICASDDIPDGWMGLDIGPEATNTFSTIVKGAQTIFWNGPMGVFEMENFANGTRSIANAVALASDSGAYSLVGGGDSVSAVNQSGRRDSISYISTGGGAMLTLLEGSTLPGVEAIGK
jgi:phosphoglycerate kinase